MKISILSHDLSNNNLGRAYILYKVLSQRIDVEIIGPKSGIPVIASDILAVRNVVKNNLNRLLVKSDSAKLANAIYDFIRYCKKREKFVNNGFKELKKISMG